MVDHVDVTVAVKYVADNIVITYVTILKTAVSSVSFPMYWLQEQMGDTFVHDVSLDTHADVAFSWRRLYHHVLFMLRGQSDSLPRTANLVQVLGNMTVMCAPFSV